MSATFTARFLESSEHDVWCDLLASSQQDLIYSSPAYLDALCAATGATYRLLGVFEGTALVAGVALYQRPSRAGLLVETRVLLFYNGLIIRETREPATVCGAERMARELEIHRTLCEALARGGYGQVVLKNASTVTDMRMFLEQGWTVEAAYTYVMTLDDPAAQLERMERHLPPLIQASIDAGLVLTADDDFDRFYELHKVTAARRGADVYLPKDTFAAFYRRLRARNLAQLFHARRQDGTIAASQLVLLGPHPGSHTVCVGTDLGHLEDGTTAFLRWKVCEVLAARGYQTNDLTDATLGRFNHFKAQVGGRLVLCFVLTSPPSRAFRVQAAITRGRAALMARVRG